MLGEFMDANHVMNGDKTRSDIVKEILTRCTHGEGFLSLGRNRALPVRLLSGFSGSCDQAGKNERKSRLHEDLRSFPPSSFRKIDTKEREKRKNGLFPCRTCRKFQGESRHPCVLSRGRFAEVFLRSFCIMRSLYAFADLWPPSAPP
mmetsp:Transcript_13191/g.25958  ORF Transcript_13191/g.25958 Transcript_13191/m.25958 type:complete len:147 (-) Transcript_13191:1191-1631(-)